jgi:2-dehydro-3-deoxyphosphooctonate aldolase (KDO 8-P synthase)
MKDVKIGNLTVSNDRPLLVIAGPCQLESLTHAQMIAGHMAEVCKAAGAQYVFKASYDKANRTSLSGRRGMGIDEGLKVLESIRKMGMPVLTDIHDIEQARLAAEVVDVIQIPAFLCRQTDLLIAAGETGAVINIKKGQFLGYNTLVADMRSLPTMARTGYPVIMDATHSVQQPGGQGTSSGGQREFAPVMARCAVVVGIAGVFIETHEDPDNSPSDGPNMVYLKDMKGLIESLMDFDRLAKANPLRV